MNTLTISISELQSLLRSIGFEPLEDMQSTWAITFADIGAGIKVDFENETIIYPEEQGMVVNDKTTCNFSHAENFVVLECVCRLMAKGYRAEHLELEPKWTLGHEQKSGKADICIWNRNKDSLLCIIECKTYGKEFKHEHKNLERDGGQLFSYWQQDRSTEWLVLYASEVTQEPEITYATVSIDCKDDANLELLAKHDDNIKLFKDARTREELYDVWAETYEKADQGDVLFSDDTVAYEIGKKPLRKRDLIDFRAEDSIVNRFEEILRHNNVSDKENAFNRLIALFICKLVDEMEKGDEDEVEFQYKVGTDTFESMQDRLQRLHQQGMREFMHEDTFYVPEDYVERTLGQYKGRQRKHLVAELNETLRKLKYYTNNDFAFKDVHNEELFYQNGKILVEVVQLFQPYRIIGSRDLQFLGDMFEQLLNKGFKQNEGQFFTPVPIARFMWDSLPLQELIYREGKITYPRVIDFACGAGHFLTEGFAAVNDAVEALGIDPDPNWALGRLFGDEKDYRLARVSKISLFMHGAGEGSIVFGDGLDNYPEKGIVPNAFDILVANPPYSVMAFKPHLALKNNELAVAEKIKDSGAEIETLFIERMHQLLKPKGVAAVVLPRTILNKNGASFVAARESLLQNFNLHAVVEFGNKTFGATGTNTAVLFLEKFDEPPKRSSMVDDSIDAILAGRELTEWEDQKIYEGYLAQISVENDDYQKFVSKSRSWGDWMDSEYFKTYVEGFKTSATLRALERTARFKKLDANAQDSERSAAFYQYVLPTEREKLRYFGLTYQQRTLVISAPTASDEQEQFLGYTWSNRKGKEGIQVIKPGGLLYDPDSREGVGRLCEVVRGMFKDELAENPELSNFYSIIPTKDMFDYRAPSFTKEMRLIGDPHDKIPTSKTFPMASLRELAPCAETRVGKAGISASTYVTTDNMIKDRGGVARFEGKPNVDSAVAYEAGDVLVSNIRPYLRKIWLADTDGTCSPDVLVFRVTDRERLLPEFLHLILQNDAFFDYMMATARGMKMPRGDTNLVLDYRIPQLPIREQQDIVSKALQAQVKQHELIKQSVELEASVQIRFIGLFGDPITNPMQWREEKLGDLYTITSSQRIYSSEYVDEGIPFLRLADISKKIVGQAVTPEHYIDSDRYDLLKRENLVPGQGDVLVTARGTVGKCYIVKADDAFYFQDGMITWLRRTEHSLTPQYLVTLFANQRFLAERVSGKQGSTVSYLSIKDLKKCLVPVPPLDLQKEFETYAKKANEEIMALNREIAKLDEELSCLTRRCYE